jgi:hypothetical protein
MTSSLKPHLSYHDILILDNIILPRLEIFYSVAATWTLLWPAASCRIPLLKAIILMTSYLTPEILDYRRSGRETVVRKIRFCEGHNGNASSCTNCMHSV